MPSISRRDALKAALCLSAGAALYPLLSLFPKNLIDVNNKPNIIVLVFDAMSARNLSLYGYPRRTTPNLERLAQRATVYHAHYSGGNFTSTGTASMLTGSYPWTHRAINLGGLVARNFIEHNIFNFLQDEYYCAAFSQNDFADLLLAQFDSSINRHLPIGSFIYKSYRMLLAENFPKDPIVAYKALDDFLFSDIHRPASPLFGFMERVFQAKVKDSYKQLSIDYPESLPDNWHYVFLNETVYAGVLEELRKLEDLGIPFFGYFHLWSPHEPYAPKKEFIGIFPEIKIRNKPIHKLSRLDLPKSQLMKYRTTYDEYIANVDFEIGKLVDALESQGILQNSYLILTSDHGEVFERGESGHNTRLLFDSVIHIPLLIIAPGQQNRQDIYTSTSNIDLLPTFLSLAGKPIPDGVEGKILPGVGGEEDTERSIFSVEAKESSSFRALQQITTSMIKGDYKLIYYLGYRKYSDVFELYNLQTDLDEVKNLFTKDTVIASRMREELLDHFERNKILN